MLMTIPLIYIFITARKGKNVNYLDAIMQVCVRTRTLRWFSANIKKFFKIKLRSIIGAPKKFKNQPRPLVRPRFVNFCQHF